MLHLIQFPYQIRLQNSILREITGRRRKLRLKCRGEVKLACHKRLEPIEIRSCACDGGGAEGGKGGGEHARVLIMVTLASLHMRIHEEKGIISEREGLRGRAREREQTSERERERKKRRDFFWELIWRCT